MGNTTCDSAGTMNAVGLANATNVDPAKRHGAIWLWILGLSLLLVYLANGRPIGAFDTMPAVFLPVAMIRGDGPYLDRFRSTIENPDGSLPLYATSARGHIVSRYPLAPAILAIPFVIPQVLIMDRLDPDWEEKSPYLCLGMAKNAAAAITAILGVALFKLLQTLGQGSLSFWTTLAAALGSNLWTVASQSLWQHGPAALALTLTMLLLIHPHCSRRRICLAGITTASLVCCRAIDVIFAIAVLFWLLWFHPKKVHWFICGPIILGSLLISYNCWFFSSLAGGQAQLESLHPQLHGVASAWSGDPVHGAAVTLVSPSYGLFTYTPWVACALLCLHGILPRLREWSLVCWLLGAVLGYFVLLSNYSMFGTFFGPRYWTDVIPLFAIVLGFSLEWAKNRSRILQAALILSIVLSVGVQVIGAFCFPSSWKTSPVDADLHHERWWDWRDNELSRCLIEGMR